MPGIPVKLDASYFIPMSPVDIPGVARVSLRGIQVLSLRFRLEGLFVVGKTP